MPTVLGAAARPSGAPCPCRPPCCARYDLCCNAPILRCLPGPASLPAGAQGGLLTAQQLASFDGREGRRLYLAVIGEVYDVTAGMRHYGKNCMRAGCFAFSFPVFLPTHPAVATASGSWARAVAIACGAAAVVAPSARRMGRRGAWGGEAHGEERRRRTQREGFGATCASGVCSRGCCGGGLLTPSLPASQH